MNPSALLRLRIIWAALLIGQTTFLILILAGVVPRQHPPQPIYGYLALAMLASVVPVTFGIRTFLLRRAADGSGPANAFLTAHIIFWAGCEGVSFTSMVLSVISSWTAPLAFAVAIAMALQLATFPRSPGGY